MPKRTNEFQRIVQAVFETAGENGITATESAMLKDLGTEIEREVDLLLECEVAGLKMRIAVECRDRRRTDSVEWIDSLIGKYRDLEVDKIIAMSTSGFITATEAKARSNRIEIRTFKDLSKTDWPGEFTKLAVGNFRLKIQQVTPSIELDVDEQNKPCGLSAASKVVLCKNEEATLSEFLRYLYEEVALARFREFLDAEFTNIYKSVADLSVPLLWEYRLPINGITTTDASEVVHLIRAVKFKVLCESSFKKSTSRHLADKETCVMSTIFDEADFGKKLHVVAVQRNEEVAVVVREAQ